jgi:CBS-domain-containing membrane protein
MANVDSLDNSSIALRNGVILGRGGNSMVAVLHDNSERLHELTVGDVMSRKVIAISASADMAEAANTLSGAGASGAPVVDADCRCIGVLSATDFLKYESSRAADGSCTHVWTGDGDYLPRNSVRRFMSTAVQTVSRDATLMHAARVMCVEHIHRLLVLDDRSSPVGVVSTLDVIAALIGAVDECRQRQASGN